MTFPTPWTVRYHEYRPGPDPYRDPPTWSPPRDQPGTPVAVYGWHVLSATDPKRAGHPDRVQVDVELFAAPPFAPSQHSVLTLPGLGDLEVVGIPEDYTHGPFDFTPGTVINLRKVGG